MGLYEVPLFVSVGFWDRDHVWGIMFLFRVQEGLCVLVA